ncbi:MAG TPA: S8 family peptidase [Gammaproteobacteria bacterium]|nr:S8 family peptidase [Gammaproteobacteria bacterium]
MTDLEMTARPGPWPGRVLLCFLLLTVFASSAWAQQQGRVMVVWAAGVSTPPSAELLAELGAVNGVAFTPVRELGGGITLLAWRADTALDSALLLARLQEDPRVEAAQADARRSLQFVPNDTDYADQWHLFEAAGIRAPAAWDLQRGSAAVVVAVLDTGILPHEDIDPARILPGYDFYDLTDALGNSHDNDGEPGWDDDPIDPGDAVLAGECGPGKPAENSSWHGLAVSGVFMATTDNALGIAGVDHRARLLPIRVFGKCGAWSSDIFVALRWAAGLAVSGVPANPNPARIINLSLSYEAACGVAEQRIIDEILARGVLIVAAGGNDGGDVANVSPASCNGVITVAASDRAGARAAFSDVGAAVDITAPGVSILTTYNLGATDPAADWYAFASGTSFSTPQVSAVLALLRADRPEATVSQLRQALQAGARPFPDSSCNTSICGAGLLDAEGAILALRALPPPDSGGGGGCVQAAESRPEALWWLGLAWVLYRLARRNDCAGRRV